jgi:hypothetical protein
MYKKKDNLILERCIILALNSFRGVLVHGKNYNFKCNVCGDGDNPRNKRGHIRYEPKSQFFYYKCFNSGCRANVRTWSAEKWLKHTSKSLYNEYIKDKFRNDTEESVADKLKITKTTKLKETTKVKYSAKLESIYKLSDTEKCSETIFKDAIEYCKKRLIPEHIWKNWYICLAGKYQSRIIIPFLNKQNKIYYFQARAFTGLSPKYLNKVENKEYAIYNIFNINKELPVIAFEGIIDSLMVENSIAIIGVSIHEKTKETLDKLNIYWLFDFDETGINKSKEYLKNGSYVFLWKEFLKDNNISKDGIKDMNEVCISLNRKEQFKFNELSKYFTNNYYDSIRL